MPELADDMYCSQQICIPPTFPYLLRQFAKAAIRTQPNDLLKWSTAYFRCLSLNIPPPVKPRLEYPIPKDFQGLTPGWLRALLVQMQNNLTIPFKVLWDRWIGACLQHENLIQILCLGGFTDNQAIPWLRFVALCAGHLTENLTQTMVLICEILTEEPEGGSAMIPLVTFLDLYQFLAKIDASKPQILKNYHFLDSFLDLFQKKVEKEEKVQAVVEEVPPEILSVTTVESEKSEEVEKEKDLISEISCPSLDTIESVTPMEYLTMLRTQAGIEYEGEMEGSIKGEGSEESSVKKEESEESVKDGQGVGEETGEMLEKEEELPGEGDDLMVEKSEMKVMEGEGVISGSVIGGGEGGEIVGEIEEGGEGKEQMEQKHLEEDLERLKAIQQEISGEGDDELEKYKKCLIAEMKLTGSQEAAISHYTQKIGDEKIEILEVLEIIRDEAGEEEGEAGKEPEYEDVYVDAIPGIGPIVPDKLIQNVKEFLTELAKCQHGMIMSRNLRHYDCPPLEILDY